MTRSSSPGDASTLDSLVVSPARVPEDGTCDVG